MTSEQIEEALARILGDSAGPPGLVVTLRKHEDMERLLRLIDDLQDLTQRQRMEISRMSDYAQLYLRALDELRAAREVLNGLGVDCRFMSSLYEPRKG